MFAKGLSYMAFTMLRDILSIPPFFKAFIIKFCQRLFLHQENLFICHIIFIYLCYIY
jgi:hypothetical protein